MGLFGKKEGRGNKEQEEGSTNVTTKDGDEKGGLFQSLFTFGSQGKPAFPVDFTDGYAQKGYTLDFLHLPSNEQHSFKAFLTQFSAAPLVCGICGVQVQEMPLKRFTAFMISEALSL